MSNGLPVVVIDPGHGGTTQNGGSSSNNASGPNGLLEKEVTLALALQIEWWLNSMGSVRVILTRRTDTNLALIDRARVAKDNNAALFLSIHLNSPMDPVKDRNVDGTEAWVARMASVQSRAFAQTVADYVSAMAGIRNRGVKEADYGVLLPARHAPNTAACLVETAFLTNPAQAQRLENKGYRRQLAQAMSEAILAPVAVTHSMAMAGVGSSSGPSISTSSHGYGIGSDFSSSVYSASALDTITLGYGVPGGKITDPFYNDAAEKLKLTGTQHGRIRHLGMDVSLSNDHGGGADDPRRGLPVYAVVKPSIAISELNVVRAVDSSEHNQTGLGIPGQGMATLQNALVIVQPWSSQADHSYGGILGLACRYAYTKSDGSPGRFTIYLEYMHLITPDFLPKDGNGTAISAEAWKASGKGLGFGPQMQNHAQLSAAQLSGDIPLLVGYLGATQFPHVHINAAYGDGVREYIKYPRFDPSVILINSVPMTQTQAIESLSATNGYGNGYTLADAGTDTLTHTQAMSFLNAANITVHSSGNCSDKNDSSCTSLEGVKRYSIDGIINFKKQSDCDITITAGTETGHATKGTRTHGNGFKLDIRKTECITNFIHKNFTSIEVRGDGSPQYKDKNGNIYADESGIHPNHPHWDITFMC